MVKKNIQRAALNAFRICKHCTLHLAHISVGIALLANSTPLSAQWLSPDTLALPPAGYGRLAQEDVSVDVRTDDLLIRVRPVHPVTLRVIASDAHDRLSALLQTNAEAIAAGTRRSGFPDSGLLLVSVYGRADRAPFSPDEMIVLSARGMLRAAQVIPLTPNWESHVVEGRRTERAFFVLNGPLNVLEPFSVNYRGNAEGEWGRRRLRLIEDELARAKGRAAADGH